MQMTEGCQVESTDLMSSRGLMNLKVTEKSKLQSLCSLFKNFQKDLKFSLSVHDRLHSQLSPYMLHL